MQLFVNSDYDGYTGFCGFDYVVNHTASSASSSTVEKIEANGETYKTVSSENISYRVQGNKMMIKVPLESIGIHDCHDIMIAFKWVDANVKVTTMDQMYSDGDSAPLGRLSYTFQNHK